MNDPFPATRYPSFPLLGRWKITRRIYQGKPVSEPRQEIEFFPDGRYRITTHYESHPCTHIGAFLFVPPDHFSTCSDRAPGAIHRFTIEGDNAQTFANGVTSYLDRSPPPSP